MDQNVQCSASAQPLSKRLFGPLERFLHIEAASGIVLLAAAAAALAWANSPWHEAYESLWHLPITVEIGGLVISQSLHFVINDGLMTIFFLVVGLEIRRELHEGALSTLPLAALPAVAAIGGVIVPAMIYLALNADPVLQQGWAVPTATDIAFAVGVLALLGRRVPPALRVLLLAIAIIDDVAAILIIAFVYSSGVDAWGFSMVAGGLLLVPAMQRIGMQSAVPYVLPGALVWFGMLHAGLHPTLAGVLLGLMTPAASLAKGSPVAAAGRALEEFSEKLRGQSRDPHELVSPVQALRRANLEMLPPVVRLEVALHPWVAFGVMPLFALANAGVNLQGAWPPDAAGTTVFAGIALGLILGKPLGILAASLLVVKLRLCALPGGVSRGGVALVGVLAGIGFTMSIFIANLAFVDAALLATAKLAVLAASAAAAALALIAGPLLLPRRGER